MKDTAERNVSTFKVSLGAIRHRESVWKHSNVALLLLGFPQIGTAAENKRPELLSLAVREEETKHFGLQAGGSNESQAGAAASHQMTKLKLHYG